MPRNKAMVVCFSYRCKKKCVITSNIYIKYSDCHVYIHIYIYTPSCVKDIVMTHASM